MPLPPLLPYLLVFCRITVALVFVISFARKIVDIKQFQLAISNFHLLPQRLSKEAAFIFLGGEGIIVFCLVPGGIFLLPGFVLASLLLLLFSGALVTVLIRKLTTSCNCFGFSERKASSTDIWRNGAFLLCALGGITLSVTLGSLYISIGVVEYLISGICAVLFVIFWLQLDEIVQIFQ